MLFNSFEFLAFLPIMLCGYYITPHKYRWLWLLLGSYFFYMLHEPELVILLLISTVVDYYCALKMAVAKKEHKKLYLTISIIVNIGMLFIFKYLSFFTSSISELFAFFGLNTSSSEHTGAYSFSQILLPVGISFYTFQTLSYTIDVYRGKIAPERHFGVFALYVSFFPQLVAGPIERASRLIPQLKQKINFHLPNIKKGLIMIAWGFFLKVVVSDRLGVYVDIAYEDPEMNHGLPLFIAAFFFAFQIYYDFSAYTSIAIGIAKTMGIDLMQNFNRPFFSITLAQFWKRWHISLMLWLKDYIFIPLGGTRQSKFKVMRNVLILFFIVGLWHGANWTFIVWGVLNGVLLIIEYSTKKIRKQMFKALKLPQKLISFLGWSVTAFCLIIPMIFFRSPSISSAFLYFENMLFINSPHVNIFDSYFELALCFVLIISIQIIHYFKGNDKIYELVFLQPTYKRWFIYVGYILIISLFAINRQNTFIYFQF